MTPQSRTPQSRTGHTFCRSDNTKCAQFGGFGPNKLTGPIAVNVGDPRR